MAFDLGSFDEVPGLEQPAQLSWRLAPDASLSDWTIKVETEGADPLRVQEYHCHRAVLGVGPRSCMHFVELFASPNYFAKGKTSTSTLVLKANAAAAMPVFLDFVYSSVDPLDIWTGSAVALLELSNHLGCRACFTKVQGFIQADLSAKTSPIYILDASLFAAEKVLCAAIKVCAASFEEIPEVSLMELEPHLFEAVVENESFACSSNQFSVCVAKYLERHEDECTAELVANLTRSEKMPEVDSKALLSLLRFSVAFPVVEEVDVLSEEAKEGAKEEYGKAKEQAEQIEAEVEECQTGHGTNDASAVTSRHSLRQRCSSAGFRDMHSSPIEIAALPQNMAIELLRDGLGAAISELDQVKTEMAAHLRNAAEKKQEIASRQLQKEKKQEIRTKNEWATERYNFSWT